MLVKVVRSWQMWTSAVHLTQYVSRGLVYLQIDAASDGGELRFYRSLSSVPPAFTANQGQWDERVLFRTNAGGATTWLTSDGAYYQFRRRIETTVTMLIRFSLDNKRQSCIIPIDRCKPLLVFPGTSKFLQAMTPLGAYENPASLQDSMEELEVISYQE